MFSYMQSGHNFVPVKLLHIQIMKNVIKTTKKGILMVALLATVTGFANNSNINLITRGDKKTAVTLEDVKQGHLLTIKDADGLTLYKETIKTTGVYTKGFDLTALPNGEYFFELEKDVQIKVMPFSVLSNEIQFDNKNEVVLFKPVTRVEDDLVYISKLSLNKEALSINIYYKAPFNDSVLVHTETIENCTNLSRVYKLEKKGNYKIVYYSQGREFTEFINN